MVCVYVCASVCVRTRVCFPDLQISLMCSLANSSEMESDCGHSLVKVSGRGDAAGRCVRGLTAPLSVGVSLLSVF